MRILALLSYTMLLLACRSQAEHPTAKVGAPSGGSAAGGSAEPAVAASPKPDSLPAVREHAAFTGTTYHVAQGKCSDKGTGTEASPFCKVAAALRKVKAGERVLIHKGVYPERIFMTFGGMKDKPITIEGEEGAILEGRSIRLDEEGLLGAKKAGHLVFRGLTLRGSTFYGVLLEDVDHVLLERLTVIRSHHGGIIVADSRDVKAIENQVIEANHKNAGGKEAGSIHESMSFTNVKRFEIARNHVKNGNKEGIDAKDGSTEGEIRANHVEGVRAVGIYLNHATKVKVHKNNVHHCGASGIQLAIGDGASGLKANTENEFSENLLWKNGFNGIAFWQTEKGDMSRNRILHNVIYENKQNGIVLEHAPKNTIVNNIIVGNKQKAFEGRSVAESTRSHNLCYRNGDSSDEGEHVIRSDPKFVNPAAGDFRLAAGSSAIDAGKPMGLAYCGKAPDLGAVESHKPGERCEKK